MIKHILEVLFCAFIMVSAKAYAVSISFTPPTEYTNNTPLLDKDIKEYKYTLYSSITSDVKTEVFPNTGQDMLYVFKLKH